MLNLGIIKKAFGNKLMRKMSNKDDPFENVQVEDNMNRAYHQSQGNNDSWRGSYHGGDNNY